MQKKKLVIIHIGLHKTGSTTIQGFMSSNRRRLNDLGFDYLCYTKEGVFREDGNAYFLVKRNNWYTDNRSCKLDIPLFISNISRSEKEKVILSSEALSWCYDEEELRILKDELYLVAEKVSVLVYIRDPVLFAISNFSEGLKYPNSVSILTNYNDPCLSLNNLNNHTVFDHFTYKNILVWKKVFGEFLCAREFNRDKFYQNNLLLDVLSAVCLNDDVLQEKALSFAGKNESLNMLQIYYLCCIYRFVDGFKYSHSLKSNIYASIKGKLHWLKSNKKMGVSRGSVEPFVGCVGPDALKAYKKLGLQVDEIKTDIYPIKTTSFSLIDYAKCLAFLFLHGFFFVFFVSKKICRLLISLIVK